MRVEVRDHIVKVRLIELIGQAAELEKAVVAPEYGLGVEVKDHHRQRREQEVAARGGISSAGDALHVLRELLLRGAAAPAADEVDEHGGRRSEEHTSELQSR